MYFCVLNTEIFYETKIGPLQEAFSFGDSLNDVASVPCFPENKTGLY